MHLDQSVKIKIAGKQAISSMYRTARRNHYPASTIHTNYLDYIKGLPKGTPQWVKFYLQGYRDCESERIYEILEFCYVVDEKLYSVRRDSGRYYESYDITPKYLNDHHSSSGYYYRDTEDIYFESAREK